MAKLRQKVSGAMRTLAGAQHFAALRSYLATTAKHGIDGLEALTRLTPGNPKAADQLRLRHENIMPQCGRKSKQTRRRFHGDLIRQCGSDLGGRQCSDNLSLPEIIEWIHRQTT